MRQEKLSAILEEALAEVDRPGLWYRVGTMSTEVRGDEVEVFAALQRAFQRAARYGDTVLVATISNACEPGG